MTAARPMTTARPRRRSLGLVAAVAAALAAGSGFGASGPAAARAAAQAADDGMLRHVIRPGDTLSELSERFLRRPSDWPRIAALNGITDPLRLPVGGVLRIPAEMLKATPRTETARIAGFQGQVSITQAGRPVPVRLDQPVAEGALIETGPNARLRLALADGSAVAVPSNTRVRIDRLRADAASGDPERVFTLLQGRMESRVASVGRNGAYSVRTPVSVSAVRGTDFRSGFDSDSGRATTEVLGGAVAVEAGGALQVLPPGFGAVATASGLAVAALPAAPYLAAPDTALSGDEAVLDIVPVPGAARYRAVLATDTALTGVLAEFEGEPGQARVSLGALPDGFHVVAVSALTSEGLEGPRSVYDLLRVRNRLDDLAADVQGRDAAFRWTSHGAAEPRYRFVLTRDGQAEPVLDRSGLETGRIDVPDLTPGRYEWRVRSSRTVLGQLVDVWSPPQTLVVR
ncbi:FecR domain-containing protein [Brevundimonas sp. VNH65]|uniref:FecR domain-containing protein n=1 Tax=Brevundimonas sp. VNH65 TaxID=3400917 RepID=UPI003BFEE9B7